MKSLIKSKSAFSTLAIVAIVVVVVVVVAAAAAYYFMGQNTANPSNPSTGPTPTNSPTTSPTTGTTGVAGATSLKYSVTLTQNGTTTATYTYSGKNLGTDNMMIRVDFQDDSGTGIFIFNAAQKQAWTYSNNQWTDISAYFDTQYNVWKNAWTGYVNGLAAWAGTGDYTYSAEGNTVRIYDIQVNPTLDDSLFTHS